MPENNVKKVTVAEFASKLKLQIIFDSEKKITLTTDNVSRPGLQLAGYFDYFAYERVQVVGQTEYSYLHTLTDKTREKHMEEMFKYDIPCIIFTRALDVDDITIRCAKKYNVPVFVSNLNTTTFMSNLIYYLNEILAPVTQLHGVLVDILGVGVIIKGDSGIGKSETALELIKRGHRLVADDVVIIKKVQDELIGTANEVIRHFMEVRGIGIIDVRNLYGASALKIDIKIELVVDLEKWDDKKEYERIGDVEKFENILGIDISKYVIPVTPGRNIAIILETAAASLRLRHLGYNAGAEIERRSKEQSKTN